MQFVSDASFVLVDLDDFDCRQKAWKGMQCMGVGGGGGSGASPIQQPHPLPTPHPQIENLNLFQSLNFLAVALEMV